MEPGSTATTALVIEVPEAEPVVADWRAHLDPYAIGGTPAHITLLFPFVPAREIGRTVADRAAATLAALPAFDYAFTRTGWFGAEVLWLGPADPAPFVALTTALSAAFPDHPPYQGAFASIVPHLTVGHADDRAALLAAERDVRPRLPITGRAGHVSLLVLAGDRWERLHRFRLGADR